MLGYDPRVLTKPFDFWSLRRELSDVKAPRWFAVVQTIQPLVFVLVVMIGLSKGGFGHSTWLGYLSVAGGGTNFVMSIWLLWLSWNDEGRLGRPTGVQWGWAGVMWGLSLALILSFVV